MKISSPIISAGSGSIAGVTAARNRGGLYLRARAVPTNPNSPFQQAVRGHMANLVNLWTVLLNATQRQAWDVYAANTPVFDTLGAPMNLTGQQMYIRSNVARKQTGVNRVDNAPTVFDLGAFTNPEFGGASAGAGTVDLIFTDTDEWANETGSSMLVYLSRGQNDSINYFKGPYRYGSRIDGDLTIPPTSPATIPLLFGPAEGNRIFLKVNVSRADGRYTQPFRLTGVVGA